MNKQPAITDATRQRILDSFWDLFRNTPIDKITAGQIAAGAGIHRSSFYRYFTDVYQVLDAFQTELLENLSREIVEILGSTPVTLPEYTEKTAVVLTTYADKLYRMLNYKDSGFLEAFANNLRPNLEASLPIPEHTIPRDYLLNYLVSGMLSNFNFWYENQDKYTLQQINAMGQKLLLHGVSHLI